MDLDVDYLQILLCYPYPRKSNERTSAFYAIFGNPERLNPLGGKVLLIRIIRFLLL